MSLFNVVVLISEVMETVWPHFAFETTFGFDYKCLRSLGMSEFHGGMIAPGLF